MHPTNRFFAAALAAAVTVTACGGGAATPSPTASVAPSPSAGPSASPSGGVGAFTLAVLPERFVGRSIGGQHVILLVTVSGSPGDGPATITAEAEGERVEVVPGELDPGEVGEVTVIPAAITGERDLRVTITATRGGIERTAERTILLAEGEDGDGPTARAHLARFTSWLATERPDLGITTATPWQGTPGSWVLVVTHHLFLSDAWELDMAWHVMTPPDDWIRINLRRRWSETAPSVAFEIPSAAGTAPPREIEPDPEVWR